MGYLLVSKSLSASLQQYKLLFVWLVYYSTTVYQQLEVIT